MEVDEPETEIKSDFEELHVPEGRRQEIIKLLKKNKDLIAKKDSDLGGTKTVQMKIDTGSHHPIKNRPYRTPLNNRKVIDEAIDEMLDAQVIRRSQSPWSFPLLVAKRKDGSDRMCVDFRTLNKIVKPISFPLPLIDDILSLIGNAKYFTTLDLRHGYWQVTLDERSKEKTAFSCHRGLFEFNRMPFGLSNAPAVFQELMNIVLQGCEGFAMAYLDDILIFTKDDPKEHIRNIQEVFNRLRQHNLKDSSDEDDIPLMELRRRLRTRAMSEKCTDMDDNTNNSNPLTKDSLSAPEQNREEEQMEIDAISGKPEKGFLQNEQASQQKTVENTSSLDSQLLMKNLIEMTKYMTSQNLKVSVS
ncbi:hypothetical protein FSP39_007863 [Pinctada imbricata]|uniref:Reverse transcriptase domain-containing protein n=1 Tax=Pinctada imbricata TaxID=66713 RepID=A0AA88YRR1_PINIB|nr:hypothetical protein FSP39_007863 [Pinctada imbricata]